MGSFLMILSISSMALWVLSSELPGGVLTAYRRKPWSSVGIKPLGVFCIIHQEVPARITSAAIAIARRRKRKRRLCRYFCVIALKPVLKAAKKRRYRDVFSPAVPLWLFLRKRAQRAGLSVSAFTAE